MKSFKQFCVDANIQEFWNPLAKLVKPQNKPKPQSQQVLAYKNYHPGVLNKKTGRFTQRPHTDLEQKRYGWKPVNASSYSKVDTPGSLTASGHKFNDNQRLVAIPYKSKKSTEPSIPFGTNLNLTTKPMGNDTRVVKTSVQDTGNFGPSGDYNKTTGMDLSLRTAQDLAPVKTSTEWGKRKIYVRTEPTIPTASKKVSPKK